MTARYIFVTGGVVSSLGKGIAVASIGRMLKARGLKVSVLKLDPYLNVDPGTMSPYQHGEVFVTVDGTETDLDLGHYERFIDMELTSLSNATAGQIYSEVIEKERKGAFLGVTIQTVPHVTSAIKERITNLARQSGADVVVVEVGGTVGDIEGQPFLEAIRQMRNDAGRQNVFYVHVTLLPFLRSTEEVKTKPTQHSVQALRAMGIQPDAILCRTDASVVDLSVRQKIGLYCDVPVENVIGLPTLDTVYDVPLVLEEGGLGKALVRSLGFPDIEPALDGWRGLVNLVRQPKEIIEIAVVGKYVDLHDSYISVRDALLHAGWHNHRQVQVNWIPAELVEQAGPERLLANVAGILVPGGFGERGINGMIDTARYARSRKVPYFGLCLGLQIMIIEFARSELGLSKAHSQEFDEHTPDPVISYMPGQQKLKATGGTMRLGSYPCRLREGTIARAAYGTDLVHERHRHRYEYNNDYRTSFEEAGLVASGTAPDDSLVEIGELLSHPFMLGTQFHPEFASRPDRPHPLFKAFIAAAARVLREGGQHRMPIEPEAASRVHTARQHRHIP